MGSMFEIWRGELYAFGRHVYRLETNGFDVPDHWAWIALTDEQGAALRKEMDDERMAALKAEG